jgi:hypothetical protein
MKEYEGRFLNGLLSRIVVDGTEEGILLYVAGNHSRDGSFQLPTLVAKAKG